jgi:hypothetical protein
MYCVVPLAGPDFHHVDYGVKAFVEVDGTPLIARTLWSRPWMKSRELEPSHLIFVLRETPYTADAQQRLSSLFPGCVFVILGRLTNGALLSAMAGAAVIEDLSALLAIDLADLIYDAEFSPREIFCASECPVGLIPYFRSDDPAYSYLRLDGDRVLETAEKTVISDHASAGTYFFGNTAIFLQAAAACAREVDRFAVKGSLFVCPAYNALIQQQGPVFGVPVSNVVCYSKTFHQR